MLENEITLTLNSPITDEQFDLLTDVDMENTPRIVFHTKNGKEVEYIKLVRCKDCKYWHQIADANYGGNNVCMNPAIVSGDWLDENWFCADWKRRIE